MIKIIKRTQEVKCPECLCTLEYEKEDIQREEQLREYRVPHREYGGYFKPDKFYHTIEKEPKMVDFIECPNCKKCIILKEEDIKSGR